MKFVLMFLFLVTAGGIANADPYVYTLTGTASGFYLPSATYNPGQAEPVAFADQPFRLTLDANVENIGLDGAETWVETQAAVSIGALAGSLAPHFVLSTLDHSDVDFSIAYFWYSSGKIISMHPQAPGFDRQGPFDFGDSVGSEPVDVNLWLSSDGFGPLISTSFGMLRLGSIDDATFTVTTAAPEPACAESFFIGDMMMLLLARHRRRAAHGTVN